MKSVPLLSAVPGATCILPRGWSIVTGPRQIHMPPLSRRNDVMYSPIDRQQQIVFPQPTVAQDVRTSDFRTSTAAITAASRQQITEARHPAALTASVSALAEKLWSEAKRK